RCPIAPETREQWSASIAKYGPDRHGDYVAPGLLMVHRALDVTPEDAQERQPYVSRRGNVMTWDGRIDNRDDLLLRLWRDLRDDTTDVAIAMAVYEKWGEPGLATIVGDWSLAIWDRRQQAIVLASDYMGVRPLFYAHSDTQVGWSTTL